LYYAYSINFVNIVAYLLTARTVDLEKHPLLGKNCVTGNNAISDRSGVFCAVRAIAVYNENQLSLLLFRLEISGRQLFLKIAAHAKHILRTIGNFPSRTPVRDLHIAFNLP
jgi:hypothetical protein